MDYYTKAVITGWIEGWQDGAKLLVMITLALGSGALGAILIWAFVVVLPAELLFDAVSLEHYWLPVALVGAGTAGVRVVGRTARLNQ